MTEFGITVVVLNNVISNILQLSASMISIFYRWIIESWTLYYLFNTITGSDPLPSISSPLLKKKINMCYGT